VRAAASLAVVSQLKTPDVFDKIGLPKSLGQSLTLAAKIIAFAAVSIIEMGNRS
jgi:hypothetical protein